LILWSIRALVLTVLALAAVLVPVAPARAAPMWWPDSTTQKPVSERIDVFRRILFDLGFQPLNNYKDLDPSNSILILLGRNRKIGDLPNGLDGFVVSGGALLLATDQPLGPGNLQTDVATLTHRNVDFATLVQSRAEMSNCFRGLDYCPLLVPVAVADGGPDLFYNAIKHGTPLSVATNLPANLKLVPYAQTKNPPVDVRPVAKLPPGCIPEIARVLDPPPLPFDPARSSPEFMVSGQAPSGGRLLFLADHSIFINSMMLPLDNNNVEFATNCLLWLRGENKQRTHVLLVEDGKIIPDFDVPLKESLKVDALPAIKPKAVLDILDEASEMANIGLAEAEKQDQLDGALLDAMNWLGHGKPWAVVGTLVAVLTIFALFVAFFRFVVHGVQQPGSTTPPLGRMVQKQDPIDTLVEQRKQGMFQVRNLWEVARQVVRQSFESAGVTAKTGDPLPPLVINLRWWRRRTVRRKVARLWAIAFGAKPVKVSPTQWPELLVHLKELQSALSNGSVVINP